MVVFKEDVEVIDPVGHLGTHGQVFKGNWKRDGEITPVYIKIVRMLGITENQQKNIAGEIDTLMKLQHPNIIKIYGSCFVERELWIVMEYMEGGNLYDRLHSRNNNNSKERIPWDVKLNLARQAALSIHALHSQAMVHRDIKSMNFLVSKDLSTLKLIDVGFSKFITIVSSLPKEVGVPRWGAPETFDFPPKFSPKSDIYSLGCTFYELVSRIVPFHEVDETQLKMVVQASTRLTLPKKCPEEIAKLISDCLDGEPSNRPTSQQILERLESFSSTALSSQSSLDSGSCSDEELSSGASSVGVAVVPMEKKLTLSSGSIVGGSLRIKAKSIQSFNDGRMCVSDSEAENKKGKKATKPTTKQTTIKYRTASAPNILGFITNIFKPRKPDSDTSNSYSFNLPWFGKPLTRTLLGISPKVRLITPRGQEVYFSLPTVNVTFSPNGSVLYRHGNWEVTVTSPDLQIDPDITDMFSGKSHLLILKNTTVEIGLSLVKDPLKQFFVVQPQSKSFTLQFQTRNISEIEFNKARGLTMFDESRHVALIYNKPFCAGTQYPLTAEINWNESTKSLIVSWPDDAVQHVALVFAISYSGTGGEFGFEIDNASEDDAETKKKFSSPKLGRRRSRSTSDSFR